MTTFLLIRHADNDYVGRAIAGWKPGIALNERGRAQAEALARSLGDVTIDGIYSSPLQRACETAASIAAGRALTVELLEQVGELHFGDWTGQSFSELETSPEWRRFNTFRTGTRIPGGEMMLETQARMVAALERLRSLHPRASLAVVSHGDVIRSALAYFLGIPLDLCQRLELDPASLSTLDFDADGVRVLGVNLKPRT
jgi:probable phosphoglycerate mutase